LGVSTTKLPVFGSTEAETVTLRRRLMETQAEVSRGIARLQSFVEFTYVAFFKILKKYDKCARRNSEVAGFRPVLSSYMRRVERAPFFASGVDSSVAIWSRVESSLELLKRSEHTKRQLWSQVQDAALLSAAAIKDVAPGATRSSDVLASARSTLHRTLEELELALGSEVGKEALEKRTTLCKARIFHSFIADVMRSADLCDPDTAAALEKLYFAHQALFFHDEEPEIVLGDSDPAVSPTGSRSILGGPGAPPVSGMGRSLATPTAQAEGRRASSSMSVSQTVTGALEAARGVTANANARFEWFVSGPAGGNQAKCPGGPVLLEDATLDDSGCGAFVNPVETLFAGVADRTASARNTDLPWAQSPRGRHGALRRRCGWRRRGQEPECEARALLGGGVTVERSGLAQKSPYVNPTQTTAINRPPSAMPSHVLDILKRGWEGSPTRKGARARQRLRDRVSRIDPVAGSDELRGKCSSLRRALPSKPPVLDWISSYDWRTNLRNDIVAGLTIGVMVIPQGLAYAGLVGIDPVYGIYSGIVPAAAYALLGTSKQGAIGPMSVPCLMMGAIVDAQLSDDASEAERVEIVLSVTMLIGILTLLLGLFRLGNMINFISKPVLSGFVSASGLLTSCSILKKVVNPTFKGKKKDIITIVEAIVSGAPSAPPLVVGLLALGIVANVGLGFLKRKAGDVVEKAANEKEAAGVERASIESLARTETKAAQRGIDYVEGQNASLSIARSSAMSAAAAGEPSQSAETSSETGVPARGTLKLVIARVAHGFMRFCPPTLIIVLGGIAFGATLCGLSLPEATATGSSKAECSTVPIVGSIPADVGVFVPRLPTFKFGLALDALFVAVVILLEHMSNVRLYGQMNDYTTDGTQELIAVGMSNMCGACFGSFAVGAGFSRSAVNNDTGARTQISLLISAGVVTILMLAVGPILAYLPSPILSCIVIVAVAKLIDFHTAKRLWRLNKIDLATMILAFVGVLFQGVIGGMVLAVGVSVAVFIYHATQPRILELGRVVGTANYRSLASVETLPAPVQNPLPSEAHSISCREHCVEPVRTDIAHSDKWRAGTLSPARRPPSAGAGVVVEKSVVVLRFESPLFFANAFALKRRVLDEVEAREAALAAAPRSRRNVKKQRSWEALVLDFSAVGWIDSTAADVVLDTVRECVRRQVPVCFAELNVRSAVMLERAGVVDATGHGMVFPTVHRAVKAVIQGRIAARCREHWGRAPVGRDKETLDDESSSVARFTSSDEDHVRIQRARANTISRMAENC
jgi:SulP family sulfate permease